MVANLESNASSNSQGLETRLVQLRDGTLCKSKLV